MARPGWKSLTGRRTWFRGPGKYPIRAYSEFMPSPWMGWRPYGATYATPWTDDRPYAWQVSEYEEEVELRPGLERAGRHIVESLRKLARGEPAHGIAQAKLEQNPYWPPELARRAGSLAHERFVLLLPLALSRTQDDKGRVRWTLFGNSEQGPDRAFWRSFLTAPGEERAAEHGVDFVRRLLAGVYGEPPERLADLRRLGFRILPGAAESLLPLWEQDRLPRWSEAFLLDERRSARGVKYLLTFRPFGALPAAVRRAYLAGDLHLLPFPGSLLFWGSRQHLELARQLPLALQIPLLGLFERAEAVRGLRVLQSGWMHEPHPDFPEHDPHHGTLRNTYRRTHRWAKVHRYEDELAVSGREDKVAHVLFSSAPDDLGLYDKPLARNAQIWTRDYRLLLDGPGATPEQLAEAAAAIRGGGQFGYRFFFPPMRAGRHAVFWHRPVVAWLDPKDSQPQVLPDAPAGYLTAYDLRRTDLADPVEFWPEILSRPAHVVAVRGFAAPHDHPAHRAAINVRKLLDTWQLADCRPLPHSFARQLLTLPKEHGLDEWLDELAVSDGPGGRGEIVVDQLRRAIRPAADPALSPLPEPITYGRTATRAFEVAYWKTIADLAEGRFLNKDNADCVVDPPTHAALKHHHRDLEALGDYLLDLYRRLIARHGMEGKAQAGDLPFVWQTDFAFDWSQGWLRNQRRQTEERDLLVRIPGRDRGEAVILADHYDTAYMEDRYYPERGGDRARVAAAGADDNHSATAALMLAAPILLDLSREGKLARDVWLVHLTGEEFPADCLGARHLAEWLVEGTLRLRVPGGRPIDLSRTVVRGVYVMDMIAHNNDHDRDVFQIAPGNSREALWLAWQAHLANSVWNAQTAKWNQRPPRRGRGRSPRSPDGSVVPAIAPHPHLHGEVRPPQDPRSSLYNTDGIIFSDAGIPAVLFMENYDINRTGYHDTHDTMANIDLDYGAALAAIAIETVARAATSARLDFDDASG